MGLDVPQCLVWGGEKGKPGRQTVLVSATSWAMGMGPGTSGCVVVECAGAVAKMRCGRYECG